MRFSVSHLTALAFCAAVTERLLLIPNVVVLPYRNPLLVAKSVATIDALSGGRFVLAVGAGYLKGEYRALGVDFDDLRTLLDDLWRQAESADRDPAGIDVSFMTMARGSPAQAGTGPAATPR